VGWKQYMRAIEADNRRRERTAAKHFREWQQQLKKMHKEAQRRDAEEQAALYENYLALLVSVHAECGDSWDWRSVANTPPPPEPQRGNRNEMVAHALIDAYKPGFFERIFGGAAKRQSELQTTLAAAIQADADEHQRALAHQRELYGRWSHGVRLAPAVLRLHVDACREALAFVGAFDELATFKTRVFLDRIDGDVATVSSVIDDPEIVPREEVKLTAGGKLTTKDMATGKYWTLYQDHVCSCAIRVAREIFATLPISRAIVNVKTIRRDTSTGHMVPSTILAVHFIREGIARLNLDAIDPSDAMKNFPHKMKFKKASGFEVVEEISNDEQWVTT
jgi:hypothetical protein